MDFSQLLQNRTALLSQARLANLAFAYARLSDYGARIERAGLRGPATLHAADPEAERFWPTLVSHLGNQSVIDEHFLDEDVEELDEILLFLDDEGFAVEFTFDLEELAQRYVPALRGELEKAGVQLPVEAPRSQDSRRSAD